MWSYENKLAHIVYQNTLRPEALHVCMCFVGIFYVIGLWSALNLLPLAFTWFCAISHPPIPGPTTPPPQKYCCNCGQCIAKLTRGVPQCHARAQSSCTMVQWPQVGWCAHMHRKQQRRLCGCRRGLRTLWRQIQMPNQSHAPYLHSYINLVSYNLVY